MPGLVVPCAPALIAGIALSAAYPAGGALATLLLCACGGLFAACAVTRRPLGAAACLVAACVPVGWHLGLRAHTRATARPIRTQLADVLAVARDTEPTFLEGRLEEDAARGAESTTLLLAVERLRRASGGWEPSEGGVRLSVPGWVDEVVADSWRRGLCVRLPAWVRVPGTFRDPGVADGDLQLARRGVVLVGTVKSAALVEPCGEPAPVLEAAGRVRHHVRAAVARHVGRHDRTSAAIVTAVLIGDRAAIDDEVDERLRRAGTYHVIAISGGNIAVLTALLLWTLMGARVPHRGTAVATIAALIAYSGVVVRGPSVDRAVFVAIVYLAARLVDLRAHPLALLATAAVALAAWDPLVVFDVGFGLTFGATAGLVALGPELMPRRRPGVRGALAYLVLAPIVASIAAESAVLPVSAVAFGRVTLAGVVLNVFAVPLMACAQAAGLLVVATSDAVPAVADLAGTGAHLAVSGLLSTATWADAVPWLVRAVPPPSPVLLAAYAAALVVCSLPVAAPRARLVAAMMAVCGAAILAGGWWPARVAPLSPALPGERFFGPVLRVTTLDVGQGDAVLVQFPDGRAMLVDSGGLAASSRFDMGRRVVTPALHALGVRRLHWLVLTHGDPDHVGGAASIVPDWQPGEIWEGVPVVRFPPMEALTRLASERGAVWRQARRGDELLVAGVRLLVHHPDAPDWERQRVRNDDSVVLELRYGHASIVLPGDIGAGVEQRLAAALRPSPLRVLKAAHHGSAGSSSSAWLAALSPVAVVYSCGAGNRFGHPAPGAIERARSAGAQLFRTDVDGAVQVATDGDRLVVTTMTGRWWGRR